MDWEALGVDDPFAPSKPAAAQPPPTPPPPPRGKAEPDEDRVDRTGSSNLNGAAELGPTPPSSGKKGKKSKAKRRTKGKEKAGGATGGGAAAEEQKEDKLKGSTCARILKLLSRVAPGGARRRRNSTNDMAAMAAAEGGSGGSSMRAPTFTSIARSKANRTGEAAVGEDLNGEEGGDWGGSVASPWEYPAMPKECWGEATTDWQVRGADYLKDSKKVSSTTVSAAEDEANQ
mmetsp:Transcript_89936/g.257210  ORF Transcript_89936/g.257210 Transcript_89936/m.257210 type:complete len:231 (+) Transcript_89936:141-833(+)